jgi:TRAP-type uncharacterized transport system fused permease subunit
LDPVLLLGGKGTLVYLAYAVITSAAGVVTLCFGVEGYFRRPLSLLTRLLYGFGGLGLMLPGMTLKLTGAGLIVLAIVGMKIFSFKEIEAPINQ